MFLLISSAATAIYRETIDGIGPILLENAFCTTTNVRLIDCSHQITGQCQHFQDVGARCTGMLSLVIDITKACKQNVHAPCMSELIL